MFTAFDRIHARKPLRTPLALMLGIFLVATFGCRTTRDNQFDILERELRTQEDYIYELEDYVVEYSQKLRQCRCSQPTVSTNSHESNSFIKRSKPADADELRIEPLQIDNEPLYQPEDDASKIDEPEEPAGIEIEETIPDELDIPELEISQPTSQVESAETAELAVFDQNDQPDAESEQLLEFPDPVAEEEPALPVQPQQVVAAEHQIAMLDVPAKPAEQVVIAQLFRNEAGEESPKALLAVVETLDADDQPVEFPGEVSLMVMTGGAEKPQRLKRWDFDPDDATSAWQSSHLGDGLHLELPLGETELPEVPLELWVRIVGQEGRKLLSQLPFEREQLAAFEVETGAQQLLAGGEESFTEQDSKHAAHAAEGLLLVAEEPVVGEQAEQPSGWKAASAWSDIDSPDHVSTVKQTSGWTAQPNGGRFPQSPSTAARQSTSGGSGPVWTAGRVNHTPPQATSHGSQPQWSPRR